MSSVRLPEKLHALLGRRTESLALGSTRRPIF
jgi:hypothetical protein